MVLVVVVVATPSLVSWQYLEMEGLLKSERYVLETEDITVMSTRDDEARERGDIIMMIGGTVTVGRDAVIGHEAMDISVHV